MIFRDTDRKIEVKGDLLKKTTNDIYKRDLGFLKGNIFLYDFSKNRILMEKL